MKDVRNRIRIALEFLKDGKSLTVSGLRLGINDCSLLTVTGWSEYLNYSNITKTNSLDELAEIKRIFSEMLSISDDLKNFIVSSA